MIAVLLGIIGIEKLNDKIECKIRTSVDDKYGVYVDYNGKLRYKNGREIIKIIKNGDIVYKDVKNGKIYFNETLQDAYKNELEAKKDNKKFFLRQPARSNYNRLGNELIVGNRFCIVNKGYSNCYVIRTISYKKGNINYYGDYYMDMNYTFHCPTDYTILNDKQKYGERAEEIQSEIIDSLNKKYKDPRTLLFPYSEHIIYLGDVTDYKKSHEKIQRWSL